MAYKANTNEERKQKIDNAFKTIEEQIPKVFTSETYIDYLNTMSKFHNYSINNQILIAVQKPEATHVAGFNAWKQLDRSVKAGEKGIMILAPTPYKVRKEVDKLDANGQAIKNEKGETEKEVKMVQVMNYRPVYVFDVSQTAGKELTLSPVQVLSGNSKEARDLLEAVEAISSYSIDYKSKEEDSTLASGANGYYNRASGEIVVNKDLPMDQKAKTLIHEFAHASLHSEENDKSREQKEIEAESIAYVVSNYFGLDSSSYSFGYVATWADGKEADELKGILNNIQKATDDIINKLEVAYLAIKEKNKDLELPEEEIKQEEPEVKEEPETTSVEVPEKNEEEPTLSETDESSEEVAEEQTEEITTEESKEETEPVDNTPATPVVEEPTSEKKEEKNQNKDIQDFGQKIGGARKDLWKERGLEVADLLEMNEAERNKLVKKDNIWKKPDYQEMVDEGLPVEVAYFYKIVRDACPTKPELRISDNTPELIAEEQNKYVAFVSDLKDAVLNCKTIDDIKNMSTWLEDKGYLERKYYSLTPTDKAQRYIGNKIYKALAMPSTSLNKMRSEIAKKEFCYSDKQKALNNYILLPYLKDTASFEKDYRGEDVITFKTSRGKTFLYPDNEKFSNPDNYKDCTWIVLDKNRKFLEINFPDKEAAEKYCLELEAAKEKKEPEKNEIKRKTALKPPMLMGVKRSGGEDYREDKDVSGQDYLDTFNFKGGEFGNWLNDKERQESLNFGYDAFKDFAKALNIKDTDITLDGELSIAFGSRGQGSALAHYEPERVVINLTKMKGAGSLGHELIHFLDDNLGKRLGLKGFMSEDYNRYQVKDKVPESFKKLMETMKHRDITPEEAQINNEKYLNNLLNELKEGLGYISQKGNTPELESKREELINKVVEETKNLKDYDCYTIKGSKLKIDPTLSPAFKEFCDFQKNELNDVNPQTKRNVEWINTRRGMISRAAAVVENPKPEDLKGRTETKFYSDAGVIDNNHSKMGKGYWQSDVELLARAGAAYIKDKLAEQGIRDDYLCGHADQPGIETENGVVYTSPQGEERKAINQAFDKFFEEVKELGLLHDVSKEMPSLDDKLTVADSRSEHKTAASKSINREECL